MDDGAEWIAWRDALAFLERHLEPQECESAIVSRAIAGLLPARALQCVETTTHNFLADHIAEPVFTIGEPSLQEVPDKLWQALAGGSDGVHLPPSLRACDWASGSFVIWMKGGALIVNSLQFRRFDFEAAFGGFPRIEGQTPRNVGGRPVPNHGEVISRVVLHLLNLSANELANYKATSLGQTLQEAYEKLGYKPPSPKNLEVYAQGILRQLRDRS